MVRTFAEVQHFLICRIWCYVFNYNIVTIQIAHLVQISLKMGTNDKIVFDAQMWHWSIEYETVKKTIMRQTSYESSAPLREQLLLSRLTHNWLFSSGNSPAKRMYNQAGLFWWPFNSLISICMAIWNICTSTKYCCSAWTETKTGVSIHLFSVEVSINGYVT